MCQTVNVIEKETKLMKKLSERVFFSFPEGAILKILCALTFLEYSVIKRQSRIIKIHECEKCKMRN